MPIHDLSYQHWRGTRLGRPPALVLARAQARVLLRRRVVWLLLLGSAIFTLVWLVLIYVESHVVRTGPLSQASGLVHVDAASFRSLFVRERLLHLLLCLAAADVVALDRRHRALALYLSRPLLPRDYVLAKAAAVALPLALASWVQGLVLVVFKCAMRGDVRWLGDQPWLPAAIVAYGVTLAVPLVLLTLALSSLAASPRQAGAVLFAMVVLGAAVGQVLSFLTRSDFWLLLSIDTNVQQVASWFFATTPPRALHPAWSLAALAGAAAASALVLHRRIRAVDVVGGS